MSEDTVETTITVQCSLYGAIKVTPEQLFDFPQGIVGLEEIKEFALIPYEDTVIYTLKSTSDDEIGLLTVPAPATDHPLEFEIDSHTVDLLEVKSPEEIVVFYIIRIIEGAAYINQKAPVLLSPTTNKGCQFIIQNDAVSLRVPLVLKGE